MATKDYKFDITAQNRTDKAFRKVNQSLDKTSKGMNFLKKSIVGAFGVAVIANFARETLRVADDLAKVSSSIGVSVEFLQRFQFAAEQSGVSAEGFDKSIRFFSKTMGEATMGLGLGLDAVDQLGISLKNAQGETKSIDDLFIEFMEALSGVENATEKAGLATKLFGRAGIPMVNMLRDGHSAMLDLALIAPGVLSAEDTKRAEDFNDAMNVLSRTIKGPLQSALISIVDAPTRLMDFIKESFSAKFASDLEEAYGRANGGIVSTTNGSIQALSTFDKRLQSFSDSVRKSLQTPTEKVEEFRAKLQECVDAGIFNESDMDAAIQKFRSSIQSGVGDSISIVKQFENTVEGTLTKSFQSFFDKTNEGFMNMKTLFSSVVDSIIKEVIRLAIIKPIVDYIMGGVSGTFASIFGRESGGAVTGGKTYLVGERGPELFTAPGNGNILPNGQMNGGSTEVVINYNITAFDTQSATQAIAQQAPTIVGIVEQSFRKRGKRMM
tara:strand:- start:190 stop:1677 length:1488 start_codon:yes stop_codon:yes gene_type:complete